MSETLFKKCPQCGTLNSPDYKTTVCRKCSTNLEGVYAESYKPVKKCPECKFLNASSDSQCLQCSTDISNIPVSYFNASDEARHLNASDEARHFSITGSKLSVAVAWIIGIAGFIAGIALGNVLATTSDFNSGVMLGVWFMTAAYVAIFALCYYHFKNQETTITYLEQTNELLEKIANK